MLLCTFQSLGNFVNCSTIAGISVTKHDGLVELELFSNSSQHLKPVVVVYRPNIPVFEVVTKIVNFNLVLMINNLINPFGYRLGVGLTKDPASDPLWNVLK